MADTSNVLIDLGSGYAGGSAVFTAQTLAPLQASPYQYPSANLTVLLSSLGVATVVGLTCGVTYGVLVAKSDGTAPLYTVVNPAGTTSQDISAALSANPLGGGGTGTVSVTGTTPTNLQIAQWASGTTVRALATTGTGSAVLASSPTIVTPTIASFANAPHTHADAAGGGALAVAPDTHTGDYTLVLADASKYVRMNKASGQTLTVPTNASVAFAIGTTIAVRQVGAGQTTIAAAGGVTLNNPGSALTLRAQNSTIQLIKVASDTWDIAGDMTA